MEEAALQHTQRRTFNNTELFVYFMLPPNPTTKLKSLTPRRYIQFHYALSFSRRAFLLPVSVSVLNEQLATTISSIGTALRATFAINFLAVCPELCQSQDITKCIIRCRTFERVAVQI